MVYVYDGETILRNLMWDVDRMMREGKKPEEILDHISLKVSYLRNPKWDKIRWWTDTKKRNNRVEVEDAIHDSDVEDEEMNDFY